MLEKNGHGEKNTLDNLIGASYGELLCGLEKQNPWNFAQHEKLMTLTRSYVSAKINYFDEYLLNGNARIAEQIVKRKENLNQLSSKIAETRKGLEDYATPQNIEEHLSKIDDMIHQHLADKSIDKGHIR